MSQNSKIPPTATKVFSGVRCDVFQWPQELFDGSTTTFETIRRQPSVGVLAVLPDHTFLLSRQSQPGGREFVSLFGGMVDAGEASVAAAHRELAEESGLHSDELMPWFSQPLFGSIEWQLDYFVARNCAQVGVQKLDAGEKIEVFTVKSVAELVEISTKENFRDKAVTLWLLSMAFKDPSLKAIEAVLF